MIISKTPLRMSFLGGGSDIPVFYRNYGGAVISSTIDKYIYVTVNKKFDNTIRASYSKTEEVTRIDEIEHNLIRECLRKLDVQGGIEITTIADIPSRGTGLGSSSSFTVGLLHALHAFQHRYVTAKQLGDESCEIEIDICKEPIGKQDQFASAFGGFNCIIFNPDDTVDVQPIICRNETLAAIEKNLLIFYTGTVRSASDILKKQMEETHTLREKQALLQEMVRLTYWLRDELQKNTIHAFGELLHENWILKKSVNSEVTTPQIDHWYERGLRAGALGGKILGAGAGGFLLFYAPHELHPKIIAELNELRPIEMKFERQGSKIIFYHEN